MQEIAEQPGLLAFFGSGETSASGRRVYDWVFHRLALPIRMAVLETPAGFQPNSALVAENIAEFIRRRLQNFDPLATVIPARKRGTPFSPDNPDIVAPLLKANIIFLGPGSPTYAVRQLQDSLAWHVLQARHRLGAAVIMASAATIAAGLLALPVYEIYKVGQDLHWQQGLDFFEPYNLSLVFVSHWDNTEGGSELDTSRCYMGQARFAQLRAMLPAEANVVGIDEHTALIIDPRARTCRVMGLGDVTLLRGDEELLFSSGSVFDVAELGPFQLPEAKTGIPSEIWDTVQRAQTEVSVGVAPEIPPTVLALVEERQRARASRDWTKADKLRELIMAQGWEVRDTTEGPELVPLSRR